VVGHWWKSDKRRGGKGHKGTMGRKSYQKILKKHEAEGVKLLKIKNIVRR